MQTHTSDPNPPIVNFAGEKVALGPYRRDLLPLYLKWINDFEVTAAYLYDVGPKTLEAREAWYADVAKGDPSVVDFTIYERATRRAIGYTTLDEINRGQRSAKFGILIGEKECWGKGYGTETARLMLDYAFNALGLHNVLLTVDADNERARRGARRRGQRVCDVLYMDCLASEFESPVLATLLASGEPR